MTIATTIKLTRAEDAYAHLASFQRGDKADVGGRHYFLPGTVTTAQQHDHSDINRAYLVVTGTATVPDGNGGWRPETIDVKVTVGALLAGKHTITSHAERGTGRVRYFDAAGYAMQNRAA